MDEKWVYRDVKAFKPFELDSWRLVAVRYTLGNDVLAVTSLLEKLSAYYTLAQFVSLCLLQNLRLNLKKKSVVSNAIFIISI